eukprot:498831-Hanusia_phi.AAC.1
MVRACSHQVLRQQLASQLVVDVAQQRYKHLAHVVDMNRIAGVIIDLGGLEHEGDDSLQPREVVVFDREDRPQALQQLPQHIPASLGRGNAFVGEGGDDGDGLGDSDDTADVDGVGDVVGFASRVLEAGTVTYCYVPLGVS